MEYNFQVKKVFFQIVCSFCLREVIKSSSGNAIAFWHHVAI